MYDTCVAANLEKGSLLATCGAAGWENAAAFRFSTRVMESFVRRPRLLSSPVILIKNGRQLWHPHRLFYREFIYLIFQPKTDQVL